MKKVLNAQKENNSGSRIRREIIEARRGLSRRVVVGVGVWVP